MGWGGARIGGGRKKRTGVLSFPAAGKSAAVPAVTGEPVPMPAGMPEDQAAVWSGLAPLAHSVGTLTAVTAESFRDLCRAIVIRDGLFAKVQEDGWTYTTVKIDSDGGTHDELKKHPLATDLCKWEVRVEAGRGRFLVAPFGKPIAAAAKVEDPFAKFDGRKHG